MTISSIFRTTDLTLKHRFQLSAKATAIALLTGLLSLGIVCFMAVITAPPANAFGGIGYGFSPQLYKGGHQFGQGIYFAPNHVVIRQEPSLEAPITEELFWMTQQESMQVYAKSTQAGLPSNHVFISFYPAKNIAMMAAIGDTEDGWVEVVYDHTKNKTGWVRLDDMNETKNPAEHFASYQPWQDFMKYNAKAHGIYWLNGVKDYHRSIRTSDKDEAKFLPVTVIRDLKVKHIRGNWMLVEVLDFERNTPIGWVRWRDSDGNLMVFPNISHEKKPIVTTSR